MRSIALTAALLSTVFLIQACPGSPAEYERLLKRQLAAEASSDSSRVATRTRTHASTTTAPPATSETPAAAGRVASKPLESLSKIGVQTTAEVQQALPTTYAAGATPPVAGAPKLPSILELNPANYPALDQIPPISSPEVQQWLSEIDLDNVPNIAPTGLNGCSNATNAAALANAGEEGNCWWTCGGCTRASDITFCPTKGDWGASFDDGPSPYTPRLLNMLNEQNLKSTFFLVGSRAISRPEMVQTEYMMGHQLSVHTWAHSSLTTLSNEEIVAELGWTMKIIRDITGVTPNSFRAPYGDVDDRVRYIALQMGLRCIIWTQVDGQQFDTRDWQIGGGVVSAPDVYRNFETFLDSASTTLDTGFIVLAHDLYQQSVDLAVDYVLPNVLNAGKLKIKTIGECLNEDPKDWCTSPNIETNEDEDVAIQTTATPAGATGAGFVDKVGLAYAATATTASSSAATSSSSSSVTRSASSSAASAAQQSGSGGTSGASRTSATIGGLFLGAAVAAFAMA